MGKRRHWLVLTSVVAILGAGCSSTDAANGVTQTPQATTVSATEPTPSLKPTPTALSVTTFELDPTGHRITFGKVEFSIGGAELSNEDPASRSAGMGLLSPGWHLYLDIAVENPNQAATLNINDRSFVSLRTASGDVTARLFSNDISPRSIIQPGATGSYQVSYEVPASFELADAQLVFGDLDTEQVVLDLTAVEAPAPSRPQPVDLSLQASVDGRVVCGPTRLAASVTRATQSLDLPADLVTTGGLPLRARLGHRFLEIDVAFTVVDAPESGGVGGGGGCVGTIVSDELIALAVNGVVAEQRYVHSNGSGEAQVGETVSVNVGFMVPTATPLNLTLGNPEASTADVEFSIAR